MAYIPLFVFLLLAILVIFAESIWLSRSGWTTSGRAWTFVVATDMIGFAIGGFVSFAIFGVMLMMAFGASGEGGTSSEASYWFLIILALLFPPVLLFLIKRLFMLLYSMPGGKRAWVFSFVAGFAAAAIVAIPPPVVYYLLSRYAY